MSAFCVSLERGGCVKMGDITRQCHVSQGRLGVAKSFLVNRSPAFLFLYLTFGGHIWEIRGGACIRKTSYLIVQAVYEQVAIDGHLLSVSSVGAQEVVS